VRWLRDESLEDSANLPDPDALAEEIEEDLRAALEQIEEVLEDLATRRNDGGAPRPSSAIATCGLCPTIRLAVRCRPSL
jgi:hypothetical protein